MSRRVFKEGQKVRFNGLNSEADFTGCRSRTTTCPDNYYSGLKVGGVYTIETIRGYKTMTDDIRLVGHDKTVEACWFSAVKEEPKVKREPFANGQKVRFIGMDEQPILEENTTMFYEDDIDLKRLTKGETYTVMAVLPFNNKYPDNLYLEDDNGAEAVVEACWFTHADVPIVEPEYDYESLLVYCLTGKHPHA